jgi:UDP-N-acetylmuramate dehydrogenase
MNWPKGLRIKFKEPLKFKNTFKIGGRAQFYCEPADVSELSSLLIVAKANHIPIHILGAGSNLLIGDGLLKGLIIRLNSPYFKRVRLEKKSIVAGSGILLGSIVKFAQKNSLGGMEKFFGIPGTLGGALFMNAGCWGSSLGEMVKEVEIMDYSGKIKKLKKNELSFSYRKSNLNKCIILGATLVLKKASPSRIKKEISKYVTLRRNSQDLSFPNAGCIFKNPKEKSAGLLIDACGLKGLRVGGVFISGKHANFILNKGSARFSDVVELMNLVKRRVRREFGLTLEPEIKIWR